MMRGGPGGRRGGMGGPPIISMLRGLGRMPFMMGMMRGMRGMPMMGMMMCGGFQRWMMPIPFMFFGMLCCIGFLLVRVLDSGGIRCILLPLCCCGVVVIAALLIAVLGIMFYQEVFDDDEEKAKNTFDEEKAKNTPDGEIV